MAGIVNLSRMQLTDSSEADNLEFLGVYATRILSYAITSSIAL
jgi:hypothetical protein